MNTTQRTTSSIPTNRRGPLAILGLLVFLSVLWVQCVEINGGASELTWTLRTVGGESTSCSDSNVEEVRLCWLNTSQSGSQCLTTQSRKFPCSKVTGVTLFEIDEGQTEFFVEPICQGGLPAARGSYQVPANIVRTVREGEIVTLNSILIVVSELTCVDP